MIEKLKTDDGKEWVSIEVVQIIATPRGFNNVFEENLSRFDSFVEAYEATEDLHSEIFGERRYTCYDSFSHVRKRTMFD